MPWMHALRDVGFLIVTLLLWRIDATMRHDSDLWPTLIAVAAGSLAPSTVTLRTSGDTSSARAPEGVTFFSPASPTEIFLFNFDSDRNRRGQFLLMSCGGFLAVALVVAFFLAGP